MRISQEKLHKYIFLSSSHAVVEQFSSSLKLKLHNLLAELKQQRVQNIQILIT